jgi:hypothetical protein
MGLGGKFLMKARDCVKTPLMAAFPEGSRGLPKATKRPLDPADAQFDLWRSRDRLQA